MISQKVLIDDLLRVSHIVGSPPSINQYKKYGKYNHTTFERRFGGWNIILQNTFGKINRVRPPNKPLISCIVCGKQTKNVKYCSRSCSAINNNSIRPKKIKTCSLCGNKKSGNPSDICIICYRQRSSDIFAKQTIADFKSTYARHKYQRIRHHAHRVANLFNIPQQCVCGYTLHTELCHIKAIKDFPKNTPLSIVNAKNNLIFLCPTHHWELENNYLKL